MVCRNIGFMIALSFMSSFMGFTEPAVAVLNLGAGGAFYSGSGRAYLHNVNGQDLPVYPNVVGSYYSYGDNSGEAIATSTGIPYNIKRPMVAISMRGLFDMGIYRIAYGDILKITAPNGRFIYVAVADTGSLFADLGHKSQNGSGRLVDFSPSAMQALGYPLSAGVIPGLTVEVVNRVCAPPTRTNKFPGCSQEQVAAQIATVEALNKGQLVANFESKPSTTDGRGLFGSIQGFLGQILEYWMKFVQAKREYNQPLDKQFKDTIVAFDPEAERELNSLAQQSRQEQVNYHLNRQSSYFRNFQPLLERAYASPAQQPLPSVSSGVPTVDTFHQAYISGISGSGI